MPSYDFGTQSVPAFPVSSSISRARVPPAIQTKHAHPPSRARSPLPPGSAASTSGHGHAHRPSTADSTTGSFPAQRDGHLLRAFDVARSRSPSPRPDAGQSHSQQQQHHQTSSHLLESGLRKLRSMGRSSKDKDKERDRAPSYAHRQAEAFNPTASAPAMALSFGNRSRTPPHNVTSFTAIRPSTPPHHQQHQHRAPPHTASASSFRPQHVQSSSLAVPAPHMSGARSADPYSASFSDTIRRDPFAARDQVEHHSHSQSHSHSHSQSRSQSRSRRNSLRENGAPQPRSGPAPAKITTSSSARKDKGKAPAYIPSNASTSSSSLPAPAPTPAPAPLQEQQRPAPAPVQEQPRPKPPKSHQKSASSGVFSGFAAAPMGMGLPSTFPTKPRTNRAVTDTSLTGVPRQRSASQSQQGEHEFVYALGNVHGSSAAPGPATFNFSIARTSSREGVARSNKRANNHEPPKPLPPVPQSAPSSAVEPQPPEPIVEVTPAAVERLAGRAKGKTPLTPAAKTPFSSALPGTSTPLTPASFGLTASPASKMNALPRQDDTMLSPMTAGGGPTSAGGAGTPLSGASALSMWEDSPLGPPPSLADAASPGARKPEPVRPAMRSRWAPRSEGGSDDEQLRSALESVLSPDTGVLGSAAPRAKGASGVGARPKMRRRASSLDSHYRLATPARTRFYDPPALFMPPTSSAVQLDNVGEEQQPRSAARTRSVVVSPHDTDARDFVNAMLRGDVKFDPELVDTRQPVRGGRAPTWELHNRGLSIDTNFEFGAPPARPKRQHHAPPPPSKHAQSQPAPQQERQDATQRADDAQERRARPKTRTVTTLWTELWHDVHSAPFDSPASPGLPVPPLPTSLATAPAHAHALPAAPSRSSTLGSAPPNSHRNSTLSTLSSVPSLSAFPMPPSPPPVPRMPAAAAQHALAKQLQHEHALAQVPGSPALPSLNFGSPLSVSFGDSPRSMLSSMSMSGPVDFLSPARSTASGRSSSVFASSPASARSFGSGSGEMLAAPSGLKASSRLVPRTAE